MSTCFTGLPLSRGFYPSCMQQVSYWYPTERKNWWRFSWDVAVDLHAPAEPMPKP